MREAIPSLQITPSWRGDRLKKHRVNFTFYLFDRISRIPAKRLAHFNPFICRF
jgi:hypothetical protein